MTRRGLSEGSTVLRSLHCVKRGPGASGSVWCMRGAAVTCGGAMDWKQSLRNRLAARRTRERGAAGISLGAGRLRRDGREGAVSSRAAGLK